MKVLLEVHGLSAFLPKPIPDPKTLRILIPDVREAVSRKVGDQTFEVCEHTPKIIFPKSDEEWPLNGEHIVISGATGKLTIGDDFLEKIADMDRIAPGAGVLDRLYLADPPMAPGPDNVRIVADMQLENGRVKIGDVTPKLALRAGSVPVADEISAELVAYVSVEIDVPGNELTIMTKKFGTREITRTKTLKSTSPDETIEVIISNGCDRAEDPQRPDEDFIIYYDLCHDYPGPKLIPFQLPPVPPGGGVDAGATRPGSCIAGLFRASA
jgi:hypothetical protein